MGDLPKKTMILQTDCARHLDDPKRPLEHDFPSPNSPLDRSHSIALVDGSLFKGRSLHVFFHGNL